MAATFNVGDRVIYDCPEYPKADNVTMQGRTGVVLDTGPCPFVAWGQPHTSFYTRNGYKNVWAVQADRLRPYGPMAHAQTSYAQFTPLTLGSLERAYESMTGPALVHTEQTIKSTSKEIPMSARNELIRANRTPDERFLLDEYIVNSDGALTSDGTAALLQWLFDTNRDAFVADLRAAYKANANATVADKAAISADEAE